MARLPAQPPHPPGFTLMSSAETGAAFTNVLAEARMLANANLLNGSGVALGDFDRDGLCDVYLCNLNGTNALFRNLGNWKFQDVTRAAGAECPGQTSTGAAFADVNGDGWLDLIVTSMGGPNALFLNDRKGHFANTTASSGIAAKLGGMSLALADIDGDGDLDLYIANYGATSILRSGGALNVATVNGQPVVRGRYAQRIKIINNVMYELGEPDALYLNNGQGVFEPVSWTDGRFKDQNGQPLKEAPWDQGLSVAFHDINGDGFPDIYVCNDAYTPDRCWINDGAGHFQELAHISWRVTSYFSMGVDFADINRDGRDDFLVVDMLSRRHDYMVTQRGNMPPQPRIPGDINFQRQLRRNTLFLNRGDGSFAEIANYARVAGSEWSWSGLFLDVDLDGWEDILVSNGFAYNADDMDTKEKVARMGNLNVEQSRRTTLLFPRLDTPNIAFRNRGNLTFEETGARWGFDSKQISNGMALADLDNDGDLDLVVNCLNAPALFYRNESAAPRIAVRLKGKAPNTAGIGARITLEGGPVVQSAEMISGGRYCSGDDAARVFAAGGSQGPFTIKVRWRSGTESLVEGALANSVYEIDETSAQPALTTKSPRPKPLFERAPALLVHQHHEQFFDDFKQQPTLIHQLSETGPFALWLDLNHDGWDDLILGAPDAETPTVFLNREGTNFVSEQLSGGKPAETSGAAFTSSTGLVVGRANYRTSSAEAALHYPEVGRPSALRSLAEGESPSNGPVAIGQSPRGPILFLGGHSAPGRYPEPGSPRLSFYTNGSWTLDDANTRALKETGVITGAVWTDLNLDGAPELVLASDWGSLRVFRFSNEGVLAEADLGLRPFIGRWQSVAAGDFDGDGRMDLVAGNWGLNSLYNQAARSAVDLYFGDLNGDGTVQMIETYYDEISQKTVPWKDMRYFSTALPWLAEKFSTHKAYAAASIEEILGDRLSRAKVLHASTLATTLFLNRGEHFEAVPLPSEAQFTPVFGIAVADFNGDGKEDLFLAQNFSAVREEDSPLNGGQGLCLLGDGKGGFKPLDAKQSGIKLMGDQRAVAVADYDHDERTDLLVTQNAGPSVLFRNASGTPGLRVIVEGPPGAILRLQGSTWKGPARELHAGAGYWSQDASTTVLASPEAPRELEVLSPGGRRQTLSIPDGQREIRVKLE